MPTAPTDVDLAEARTRIHALLIRRMAQIRFPSLPSSYYVGQEYVEDQIHVDAVILCHVMFPGFISPYEFWLHGAKISLRQRSNVLEISIIKKISLRLFNDIRYLRHGEAFIIGYIAAYLPRINRYILDQRYLAGHSLSKTFAVFELFGISVFSQNRRVLLRWPPAFTPFPRSAGLAPDRSEIYIRDYIDACNSFFRNDYDDCVRRIITSAENFMRLRGWKVRPDPFWSRVWRVITRKKQKNPNSFRRVLGNNLRLDILSGEVLKSNMDYIYFLRNKIVHDGFRMPTSSGLFCSKALATLKYILQYYCNDRNISTYIYYLHMQFGMQCTAFGEYNNLDIIKKTERMGIHPDAPVIDSNQKFEIFMFSTLRFTAQDKAVRIKTKP